MAALVSEKLLHNCGAAFYLFAPPRCFYAYTIDA